MLDIFLTFGFESYFSPIQTLVSVRGFATRTPKKHLNVQLRILHPANAEASVTPQVDRVSSIQAVFNYCYEALSRYAQSALSTTIGGEPY
jgi:hypothetical protein